jgi:hypothetical protein
VSRDFSVRKPPTISSLRISLALFVTLFALACQRPPSPEARELYDASLDLLIDRTARAQRVGQLVSLGGSAICSDLAPVSGAAVLRIDGLPPMIRDAAQRRFGSKKGVFVTRVFDNLPAAQAGIQPGDRIVRIEGDRPVVPSWQLLKAGVRAVPPLVLPRIDSPELGVEIERLGTSMPLRMPVRMGCASPVSLAVSDLVNAFAWRDQVVLLSGLLRFMPRDEALALVVGHEIGHVVLGHTRRNAGSSQRVERDADYLGAYLASRAGFELAAEDYALFRLSYEDPIQLAEQRSSSHPSGPERQLAFERTLQEIERKRAAGSELLPEGFE